VDGQKTYLDTRAMRKIGNLFSELVNHWLMLITKSGTRVCPFNPTEATFVGSGPRAR
jgi:hypothetical protein